MAQLSIIVNGQRHVNEIADNILLVDYIRETLALTGTHIGCDTSQCGACVVHVNGISVKSCTMLAAQADGAEVTTIEGISDGENLHPVGAAAEVAVAAVDEAAVAEGVRTTIIRSTSTPTASNAASLRTLARRR